VAVCRLSEDRIVLIVSVPVRNTDSDALPLVLVLHVSLKFES
jgi:hypothetical protein